MKQKQINEIRALRSPPRLVYVTLESLHLLLAPTVKKHRSSKRTSKICLSFLNHAKYKYIGFQNDLKKATKEGDQGMK